MQLPARCNQRLGNRSVFTGLRWRSSGMNGRAACPASPRSPTSSQHSGELADLSAPLAPKDAIDDIIDKLRLCGIMARRVLGVLGFGAR